MGPFSIHVGILTDLKLHMSQVKQTQKEEALASDSDWGTGLQEPFRAKDN